MRASFHIIVFCVIWVVFPLPASYAQTTGYADTLSAVKVRGKKNGSQDSRINDFSPGMKVSPIDTALLQQYRLQNLSTLLAQQTPVFVKSYGFNGLATLNFRGSSAAQSGVFWNGIPIQNAALGIADVSAIPISLINKAELVYGSSSALWGSGNVGGALVLENDPPVFDTPRAHVWVDGGAGSFAQYLGGASATFTLPRWYFSAHVFAQTAVNNFPFTNVSGQTENMPHSRLSTKAALFRAAYKASSKDVFIFSAWAQVYDRQIPPELPEPYSLKTENDGSLRLLGEWQRHSVGNNWYARVSLVRDEIVYDDPAIVLHTDNSVYQYYLEAGWKKTLGSLGQVLLFTPIQYADLTGLDHKIASQQKIAVVGAYEVAMCKKKGKVSANARLEQTANSLDTTQKIAVLLPGADASFQLLEWLTLRANVQETYRTPSLNELYFDPGGNPQLRPEKGWSEDAGYVVKVKRGSFSLVQDVSVYNRLIDDWILWLGGAVWTPRNIAEVHSHGVETGNEVIYSTGQWAFHIGVNTAYVIAATTRSYLYQDGSIGKQIPYTPRYNGQAHIGFNYQKWALNYSHTYTGYRFITNDDAYYLPPYQTGNLMLTYGARCLGRDFTLTGQCNNIWNQQYQVVAYRPMPGTNWLLAIKAQLL